MIRIYDKEEKIFSNLGLGSLDEVLAALVVEELNGSYELEIQYPVKGRHFDKLQLKNIIFCKPNMYTREQPFRIYSITKPIDGKVTVNAEHISYDASGVTILPKRNTETKVIESFGTKVAHNDEEGYFLDTILSDIKDMSALPTKNYFNLIRGSDKENVFKKDGYSIPAPTNLRSILGGDSGSILEKFKGEYLFDRFDVILKNKRGVDRGLTIRYGKNMTDIEHESEGNNLFTAIFPFYSKKYTETQQTTKPIFQETYIIEGVTPLRADWLSIELIDVSKGIGGINLKPVVEVTKVIVDGVEDLVERYAPIRVKTPNDPENPSNDFYDNIYVFKKNTEEDGNLIKAYVSQKHTEQITVNDEIKDIEVITELKLNIEDVTAILPAFGKIYVIQSEDSEHYNRKMVWDKGSFSEYSSDGFYVEAKDATLVDTLKDLKPIPTYPISWDEINSKWIRDDQNGSIYVEPKKPNIGTVSVDKYVYVDLLEYELPEESDVLLENGVMYVNETLKNLSNQRVLTLDLTGEIDSIDNLEPTDITSQHLFDKAEQYLKDNDLTKLKESITISFIKLSDSSEYEHLKALEIVELGDEINVIYEELGINSKHRVIATHYNVLTDSYDEIELGEKTAKITNNIVSSGDNISSLKNDAEYTEKTYVVNFVAENANIINAEIQKAIIQTLEASNVNISGLLVASHATIDDLVSQMLVTDNAKISELLEAGSVRVRGKITALSGEIGGCKIEDGKLQVTTSISIISEDETKQFEVNENGEVTANSITITGGSITIGKMGEFYTENVFEVTNEGHLIAKSAQIGDAYINEEGRLMLPSANITGLLNVDGKIDAALIEVDDITIGTGQVDGLLNVNGKIDAALIEVDDIMVTNSIDIGNGNFRVDNYGKAVMTEVIISASGSGGSAIIGDDGVLIAQNAVISGSINTDILDVQELQFNNGLMSIKSSDESTTTETSISVTTSLGVIQNNLSYCRVTAYATADWNLPEARNVTLHFSYYQLSGSEGSHMRTGSILIQIPAGSKTANNYVDIAYLDYPPTNFKKTYQRPSSFTFYTTTGTVNLGVNRNFVPATDDTYDLGSSQKRWDDIYATNGTIQTSDKRQKEAINYDISKYDQLFDRLKPVSYKFIDGQTGRKHLGFISQDIKAGLDEIGMGTVDFAGFIKSLLPKSKEKAPEDLTEDDYVYGIRYSELHAMEVRQIQLLKDYIQKLEARIAALESDEGS